MKLLIELDEEYVKAIDKIRFLVGGRTDRKLQLEIIKAIKNGKPLEQEPTTKNDLGVDLISREQAKTAIRDKFKDLPSRVEINTILNGLPSVTPQEPRWILTTERLPKDRDWYLGIFKEPDTGWINPLPFICDYVGSKTKATTKEYWILRGFTDRDEHIDYYFNLECVAWMPLPPSYERDEEV